MSYSIDPAGKLKIIGLEGGANGLTVTAQFNPKEISVDRSIPWQKQKKKGPADLEFTGGDPKTMSFELMFDGFETGQPVQVEIEKLHKLSDMDTSLKRPPKVKVIWGSEGGAGMIPKFECVIESVAVKYTMFDGNGVAVRATANIKVKEAGNLAVGKPQ